MERRDFVKSLALVPALVGGSQGLTTGAIAEKAPLADAPVATEAQKKWMELGFGMFVHFSINTFNDTEWSDGTLDPKTYNPTLIDTDQWARTAANAGMKYLVIITKHHDGFCNWPTQYTDYSVKNTPFNKDLVRMVVDSARKYGLQVGMYYSLWDRHEKTHDQDDGLYADYMRNQLQELLTGYGPIVELWFDGYWKKQKTGWKDESGKENPEYMMEHWRNEGAYRWQMDSIYQFIHKLQPDCMVMNNGTTSFPGMPLFPCDIRSGEKAYDKKGDQKVWNWLGKDVYLPLQIETTMSVKSTDKMFSNGNWFWHEWDHSVASVEQIQGYLAKAKELQANLLLNVGPSKEGLLRKEDQTTLASLGKKLGIKPVK